jgi:hypothetical protein
MMAYSEDRFYDEVKFDEGRKSLMQYNSLQNSVVNGGWAWNPTFLNSSNSVTAAATAATPIPEPTSQYSKTN